MFRAWRAGKKSIKLYIEHRTSAGFPPDPNDMLINDALAKER